MIKLSILVALDPHGWVSPPEAHYLSQLSDFSCRQGAGDSSSAVRSALPYRSAGDPDGSDSTAGTGRCPLDQARRDYLDMRGWGVLACRLPAHLPCTRQSDWHVLVSSCARECPRQLDPASRPATACAISAVVLGRGQPLAQGVVALHVLRVRPQKGTSFDWFEVPQEPSCSV